MNAEISSEQKRNRSHPYKHYLPEQKKTIKLDHPVTCERLKTRTSSCCKREFIKTLQSTVALGLTRSHVCFKQKNSPFLSSFYLVWSTVLRESPCLQEPDGGTCHAALKKWYFSADEHKCKMFVYGGCEGNENRFLTEKDCEKKCIEPKEVKEKSTKETKSIQKK